MLNYAPSTGLEFLYSACGKYDKRHADRGIGVTLGERPGDFIYFQHLSHDLYYNEKNFYDQFYYLSNPVEHTFETGWSFGKWKFRTRAVSDSKVHQYFPEKDLNFTYQGPGKTKGCLIIISAINF
ncbi:MAG: hypothetical protein Ct9H90mP8_3480 [Pseudomonadota bacterium]|nr:MAG: hypothetical protein Ct9H90mP8_3480 [Pseudomonadota bacterium]